MQRGAIRLNVEGVTQDIAFGAVTSAVPFLKYDSATKTIKGAASAGGSATNIQFQAVSQISIGGTFTDIPGMSFQVDARSYVLDFNGMYTATLTGLGLRLNLTNGAAFSACRVYLDLPSSQTGTFTANDPATKLATSVNPPSAGPFGWRYFGGITFSVGGTMTLQAQEQ